MAGPNISWLFMGLAVKDWEFRIGGKADDGGGDVETRKPVRAASMESHVHIPLNWALISAGLAFALLAVSYLVFMRQEQMGWGDTRLVGPFPWQAVPIVPLLVGIAVWIIGVTSVQDTIWQIERVFNTDLDGDNVVGQPQTVIHEYHVDNDSGDGMVTWKKMLGIPCPPDKLATYARAVLNGRSTGGRTWAGKGGLFGGDDYEKMRDRFFEVGYAHWENDENHKDGWVFNAAGRSFLRKVSDENEAQIVL